MCSLQIKLFDLITKPLSSKSYYIIQEILNKYDLKTLYEHESQIAKDLMLYMSWFYGPLGRKESESLLKNEKTGCFIVRISDTLENEIVLTLKFKHAALHFPIIISNFGLSFQLVNNDVDVEPVMNGLEEIINYYQKNLTSLPCKLIEFVPKQHPPSCYTKSFVNKLQHHMAYTNDSKHLYLLLKIIAKSHSSDEIVNLLNQRSLNGSTMLHIAVIKQHQNIFCILLKFIYSFVLFKEKSLNLETFLNEKLINFFAFRDINGNTIFHYLCKIENLEFLRNIFSYSYLLENLQKEINSVRVQDNQFNIKLESFIQKLISIFKSIIMMPNPFNGNFPIHECADVNNIQILKFLILNLSMPIDMKNLNKDTPKDIAINKGYLEMADFLEEQQKKSEIQPYKNYTNISFIDREKAENILFNDKIDGSFILRTKGINLNSNNVVLSLFYQLNVFHFMLNELEFNYFAFEDGPLFSNLKYLIAHYSRFSDGLPCNLTCNLTHLSNSDMVYEPQIVNSYPLHEYFEDPSINCFTLKAKDIKIDKEIGSGEFGSVYMGKLMKLNNESNIISCQPPIAIKTLHQNYCPSDKENFLREAHVMNQLKNEFIVKLIGICTATSSVMIILEFAHYGSLWKYIPENKDKINEMIHFPAWAFQIAQGMKYLEENHYVHRDLAARNILLFHHHKIKITDFGLSRVLGHGSNYYKSKYGGKWPIKWYAPESINFGKFSHASDIWSYGITLWEIYSFCETPYGEMSGLHVISEIEKGYRLPKPLACPQNVYALILKCWHIRSCKRPNFIELSDDFRLLT